MAQKTEQVKPEKKTSFKDFKLIKVKTSVLKFDDKNPNEMTEEQVQGLIKSIKKFGNIYPILIDQNNFIVHGNHRAQIYKDLGVKEIPAFRRNFTDDAERILCAQAMNKIHGKYDNILDANQLTILFKRDKLNELLEMIAKRRAEVAQTIQRYSQTATKALLDQLFGEDSTMHGTNSLARRFGVPPFSILDTTTAIWRERKDLWLQLGLQSEQGREDVRYFNKRLSNLPSASIFDPVLAEISYRWFTPFQNCKVLDPFSGGSVRGIVAAFLGYDYHGVDLRKKQVNANEATWTKIQDRMPKDYQVKKPNWHVGDSANIDDIIGERNFDMLLTSPPYFQQEHYSNLPQDLNNMNLEQFIDTYKKIITKCCDMLTAKGSFVVWNTTNTRDPNTGKITNIIHIIIDEFQKHGFFLLNDLILMRSVMSLQVMAPQHFVNKRFVGSRHEHVLVFFRGIDKSEIPKLDIQVVDIPQNIEE